VLLDTSTLIWLHRKPGLLGKKTTAALQKAAAVYFSPLSLFEIAQKDGIDATGTKLIAKASIEAGLVELPVSAAQVLESSRFGTLRNTDPFDLLLISQAVSAGFDFYTSDQRLLALGFDWIKDASL